LKLGSEQGKPFLLPHLDEAFMVGESGCLQHLAKSEVMELAVLPDIKHGTVEPENIDQSDDR
jgi:hypothetical protein